jgi:hypothetical protein
MFILSAIHRGFTARFWQVLFLITFSGLIVRTSAMELSDATLEQLMAVVQQLKAVSQQPRTENHWAIIGATCSGMSSEVITKVNANVDEKFDVVSHRFDGMVHVDNNILAKVGYLVERVDYLERKLQERQDKAIQEAVLRFDSIDRRFDSVDRRVEGVAQTVNDTRTDIGNLYIMVSDIKAVLRSWVNPERWIASGRMLWSVGYLGYYARGRSPTLKLVIMFVVCMALDLYHFYANSNTVAEFLVRTQDSHVCEWIKTAISVGLVFVIKAWGYDPQLKEMRIDTIERNTTETHGHSADTHTRLKRFESDISARFAKLEEYLRRTVGASPPLLPSHVQPQPASASQVDSDSDSESLFAETNTTEGKVEPGRSVSPAPAVMLKDRLLSYTYDRNGLSARIAAL